MKKYYITGVPGIGKTTLLNELQKRGYATIDIDYVPGLCYWINRTSKEPVEFLPGGGDEWEKKNTWICDKEKLHELLNQQTEETLFVCGLTNNQAEFIDLFDKVFLLQTDASTFLNRMASRNSDHFGYHEADRNSVLLWYKEFEKRTLNNGAVVLDATQPIEQNVAKVISFVR